MDVKAIAKHIHQSPQKVRLVIDVIRGKKVGEAKIQLQFMKKAAARPVLKLLNSALANASHNFKLDTSDLYVKSITADGGPILHRWMPRAQGRATPIRKRTTHIAIVIGEKRAHRNKKPVDRNQKSVQKSEA